MNIISYSFLVDGRGDEEFEQLLEKHAVDEIEAKPKNFYSKFCNRWMSICGVSTKSRWFYEKSINYFKIVFLLAVPDQGGADVPYSLELLLALHRHLHWDLVVHWTDCTGVQPGNRLRVLATYLHHRSRG